MKGFRNANALSFLQESEAVGLDRSLMHEDYSIILG